MQPLKKNLLEGLIQVAILLSLCGVRVDVGLEPYLPRSWPQSLLGPTSALTQTHFHNLRNRLEGGTGEHLKTVDLDEFFTTRRLLGWVRSLDRLQVPQAQLETWLVQQDPSPLPVMLLQQTSDRLILPEESRTAWDNPDDNHPQEERQHEVYDDDEDMDDEEQPTPQTTYMRAEGAEGPEGGYNDHTDSTEMEQDQENQSSASLQECLRLLEETFPFTGPQQERVCGSFSSSVHATHESAPSDMEQQWQDLLDLMEPQTTDAYMMTLVNQSPDSVLPGSIQPADPVSQNFHIPQGEPERPLMETYLQPGVLEPTSPADLLPLVPSDQLDNHSLDMFNININNSHNRHSRTNLLAENFNMGLDANANSSHLNLLSEDLVDHTSFLLDQEDMSGGLDDILDEAAILEEMSLLDMALEEGFSPEMAQRLEEEGYLDPELTHRTSQLSLEMEGSTRVGEEYSQTVDQDVENDIDSDSGLSLDSSHSPASPCQSESSSYSSSSSSSSASSLLPDTPPIMELEVTIKQEPLDEDELGAVGGGYYHHPNSKNIFSSTQFHDDYKLFDGFPWLEQISHDHTYNQPLKMSTKLSRSSPKSYKPYELPKHICGRDERRARVLKIPFSNELIVNLPVEDFNDLLASYELDEEQLNLVRDIRRRGKNKIAAQNCRKRKMDNLQGLEKDVTMLRRHRKRLLKDKQEALRSLQGLKQRLGRLYEDVFSQLRDEEGRALDVNEYLLNFGDDGSVDVVSRRQHKGEKSHKKPKDKKK